ncbi:MAG: efflux RND transporter permease subunit, partial [Chloroflexia bacterium]|nr:efflux RND transporter permease subunit [Chloroflexia bacterium]
MIYNASVEIRSSIVQATLIIIVAFIPLFFLSGMEGRMLKPLGITFIVSLFASLVVAVSLTPVLSSYLLTGAKQLGIRKNGNRLTAFLTETYSKSISKALYFRKTILISAGVLLVVSLFVLARFGKAFLPEFKEGTLTITAVTAPGVSLGKSNEIIATVDKELLQIPEIKYVSRRTGRAELNEHSHGGSNSSEIDAPYSLYERSYEEFMEDVRIRLGKVSGININIGQPLGHRIDHML